MSRRDFVTACLICRNSERSIEACLKSLDAVDFINITDTGSKDGTIPLIHKTLKRMKKPYKLTHFKWIDDFAAARNFNLVHVPPESEWIMWLDSDDVVEGGEHMATLLKEQPEDVGAIWFPYNYAQDEFGNIVTTFERERLLRARYGWLWRSRLHETIQSLSPCKHVREPRIIVKHNHGPQSRSTRNFKHLNIMLREEPNNKRVWLYLGHQWFAEGNFISAAEWYLKFSSATDVTPIDKYQALTYVGKALRNLKDYQQAINCDLLAIELYPEWADGYIGMAMSYNGLQDYQKTIHWGQQAKTRRAPDPLIFINPLEYSFNLPVTLAEAYMKTEQWEKALVEYEQAHKVRPSQDVAHNLDALKSTLRRAEVIKGIKALAVSLLDDKELLKLRRLPDCVPYWMRESQEFRQLLGGVHHYTSTLEDRAEIIEEQGQVIINLDNALDPEALLGRYTTGKVTLISSRPLADRKQVNVYSISDMEQLATSAPGRHILNLRQEEQRVTCEYDHSPSAEGPNGLCVRFYVGPGLEYWDVQTIREKGCGGSETAAAYIAMAMAKQNCLPLVYARDTQVWDGAIFRHFSQFQPNVPASHLFISSRIPDVFYMDILAKQKWLWMHDVHCWDRLTPEVAEKLDAIVVLSHWHAGHVKRCYPWLADCQEVDLDTNTLSYDDNVTLGTFHIGSRLFHKPLLAIIGDGIDTERFINLDISRKKPHSFIWCSSPDRGLEQLLGLWTLIRKEMPDATLDIFYGWEYFDSSLHIPAQRELKSRIQELIKQEGITWRGRVGQLQLAQEMTKTEAWLYPPGHDFRETFCISALEAQAAGVLCFYRMNGALGETIGPERGVPLPLNQKPEETVAAVVEVLRDADRCHRLRKMGREYALSQSWEEQATKMLALYNSIERRRIDEKTRPTDNSSAEPV